METEVLNTAVEVSNTAFEVFNTAAEVSMQIDPVLEVMVGIFGQETVMEAARVSGEVCPYDVIHGGACGVFLGLIAGGCLGWFKYEKNPKEDEEQGRLRETFVNAFKGAFWGGFAGMTVNVIVRGLQN